jgi:hypothetical protein
MTGIAGRNDDAALCEHLGLRVVLTPTHDWNTLISE